MIVSLFSSCSLSGPFPKWTLFGAFPFVRDLLLEFCLPGCNIGASGDGLAVAALGLPLWVAFVIAAASAGQAQDCNANLQVNYNTSRASDLPTTLSPSDQGFCHPAHYISPGSKGRPGAQPSLTSPALFAP